MSLLERFTVTADCVDTGARAEKLADCWWARRLAGDDVEGAGAGRQLDGNAEDLRQGRPLHRGGVVETLHVVAAHVNELRDLRDLRDALRDDLHPDDVAELDDA